MPTNYIWPLSNSTTPDKMNTSFGPRINRNRWDFHDGIDLPTPVGTRVYAMREGTVHRAGAGGTGGFSSRHILIEADEPTGGRMYNVYVHLDSIDPAVVQGAAIAQGQEIGTSGDDDATYPHLHIEFRKGTDRQIGSVHPLGYLPYPNTSNFTAPVGDRFHRAGGLMAARLLFGAASKLEGDLQRVEVDLKCGVALLATRVVDFDDKTTVNEGNSDEFIYVNDIGVEGYQKSNMVAQGRGDLRYGILVRNIPAECSALIARVIDRGGNAATSASIAVPDRPAIEECVDFEPGEIPAGWSEVTSASGAGTSVKFETTEDHPTAANCAVMVSIDTSTTETTTQRAGIERALPEACAEWTVEGWFNPAKLGLDRGQTIYLLQFLCQAGLMAAAHLYKGRGPVWAGISARNPDGSLEVVNSRADIVIDNWRKWKLRLLRIGTRETTAVLYLDDHEKARVNWDTTDSGPLRLRAGIGRSSAGATAIVHTAELRVGGAAL
jgi:Peptidase family M23